MARERFYFYEKWWRVLDNLPEKSALAAYRAACALVFDEEDRTDELDTEARVAFMFMKQEIERDQEAYNLVVERNRTNGAKGGRPKENPEEPKKPSGLSGNPKNPSEPDMSREDMSREEEIRKEKNKKNINNSLSLADGNEREKEIFIISLHFLRKGIKLPASEAADYYNYYQASGWRKSNEHQTPILDRIAYADTWKPKRETIISDDEGKVWADAMEAVQFTNMNLAKELINGYRGGITPEQGKLLLFFSKRETARMFVGLMQQHEDFKSRIFAAIRKNLPGIENIATELAANDPRR